MTFDLKAFTTPVLVDLRKAIKEELALRGATQKPGTPSKNQALLAVERYHARGGELKPEVEAIYSTLLLSAPFGQRESFDEKRKYLRCILAQDWSHLFKSYEDSSSRFYVYAHLDPRKPYFACKEINVLPCMGEPFYIGKGTGNRAFDLKRNQGHGKTLKYLLDKGYEAEKIVRILFDGLSERKSMEIEAKLIYFFGTLYEKGRRGTLVNLDLSVRPNFVAAMGKKISPKVERLAREMGLPLPNNDAWREKRALKLQSKKEQEEE